MESITVRCKMCKHAMKFAAQKAGKRAKCPKCDAIVLIQADAEAKKPEPEADPQPAAAPEPKPADDDDEYDAKGAYGVFLDPEIEERQRKLREEEENKDKKKDRKALPKVGRKIKAIPDAESWKKVRLGLLFIMIGTWIWLGCHLLQGTYLIFGSVDFPEYATLIGRNLERQNNAELPQIGQAWNLDWLDIYVGMIAGRDFAGYARVCLTISSVFFFFQALLWFVGYCCCLPVPRRFGMFGNVIVLLILGFFNPIFNFIFKFLPVVGLTSYVLIPFVTPEISMTEYNMERMIPIQVLWSGAPFWESVLNLILKFLVYFEPAMLSIFIWSAGIAIKDDKIAEAGHGRAEMALGTFFIIMTYHLLSLCGASPIIVNVMRVVYGLWFLFHIIFLLQLAMLLMKFRAVLYDKIHPRFELEEEEKEDEDEEEEEDQRPRKKKKK